MSIQQAARLFLDFTCIIVRMFCTPLSIPFWQRLKRIEMWVGGKFPLEIISLSCTKRQNLAGTQWQIIVGVCVWVSVFISQDRKRQKEREKMLHITLNDGDTNLNDEVMRSQRTGYRYIGCLTAETLAVICFFLLLFLVSSNSSACFFRRIAKWWWIASG